MLTKAETVDVPSSHRKEGENAGSVAFYFLLICPTLVKIKASLHMHTGDRNTQLQFHCHFSKV